MFFEKFKDQLLPAAFRIVADCWWILAILAVLIVISNRLQAADRAKRMKARRAAWRADIESGVRAAFQDKPPPQT